MRIYELRNSQFRTFTIEAWHWIEVLEMAENYGWTPAGTVDHDDNGAKFVGNYDIARGQMVTDMDAIALAFALRKVLKSTSTLLRKDARKSITNLMEFCHDGIFAILRSEPDAEPDPKIDASCGTIPAA